MEHSTNTSALIQVTTHNTPGPYLFGHLPPFLTPECCQKWQMGLLWGKESQPLLWQCLKTLVGSIGNTRMATKGIYNPQSQYTMAIPLTPHALLFDCPECCQKLQMGLLPGEESQPLLWQCLKTLLGSMEHTIKALLNKDNKGQLQPPITTNISHT